MSDSSATIRTEQRADSTAGARFTPGPWHFVEENVGLMFDHGYGILYGEPDCFGWEKNLYVSVGCSTNAVNALGQGVPEANAHLISAAPDMYKALKQAREWLLGWATAENEIAFIDAALAKAEGR